MDIDTTINRLSVSEADVERMVQDIIGVQFNDGVLFQIKKIHSIMDEAEYPSMRVNMQALFDGTVTPLRVDVSTGDAITPSAIQYNYKWKYFLQGPCAVLRSSVSSRCHVGALSDSLTCCLLINIGLGLEIFSAVTEESL